MAVSNVTLGEKDLYYQWLINNNSTSTMLNALSGSSGEDSSSLGILSSLANTALSGSLRSGSAIDNFLTGAPGSLTGVQGTESVTSFAKVLESYLSKNSSGILDLTQGSSSVTEAAQMAEKLSGVLEEAEKNGDTSSLTYKTVKEIYEYFSGQVSGRAAELLGEKASLLKQTEGTASGNGTASEDSAAAAAAKETADYFEQMDQMAVQGEEFDFSVFDELIDNSFGEKMPLS